MDWRARVTYEATAFAVVDGVGIQLTFLIPVVKILTLVALQCSSRPPVLFDNYSLMNNFIKFKDIFVVFFVVEVNWEEQLTFSVLCLTIWLIWKGGGGILMMWVIPQCHKRTGRILQGWHNVVFLFLPARILFFGIFWRYLGKILRILPKGQPWRYILFFTL